MVDGAVGGTESGKETACGHVADVVADGVTFAAGNGNGNAAGV